MNNSIVPVSVCLRWLHFFFAQAEQFRLSIPGVSSLFHAYVVHFRSTAVLHSSTELDFSVILSRDSVRRGTHAHHFGSTVLFSSFARGDNLFFVRLHDCFRDVPVRATFS